MALVDESTVHMRPRLSLLSCYDEHLWEWTDSTQVSDLELLGSHGFGNSHYLSNVFVNPDLTKAIVEGWIITDRVFRFGMIEIWLTIKESAWLIGVLYVCEKVVAPSFEPSFQKKVYQGLQE